MPLGSLKGVRITPIGLREMPTGRRLRLGLGIAGLSGGGASALRAGAFPQLPTQSAGLAMPAVARPPPPAALCRGSVEILLAARRTLRGSPRPVRALPSVVAVRTHEGSRRVHLVFTSHNPKRLSLNQSPGHLSVRRLDDPSKSLARDVHPLSGLLLIEALQISEPQSLALVHCQDHLLERPQGKPPRLEVIGCRQTANASAVEGPGHEYCRLQIAL